MTVSATTSATPTRLATTPSTESRIDPLLSETFHTDPASVLARLRVEDPVHEIPGIGGWMISRYDAVRALFTHLDTFDIRRDTSRLTIFGHGTHYCVWANVARTELACMFEAFLDVLPRGARLLEDEIQWDRTGMFSRIGSLPIDFGS